MTVSSRTGLIEPKSLQIHNASHDKLYLVSIVQLGSYILYPNLFFRSILLVFSLIRSSGQWSIKRDTFITSSSKKN